MLLCIAISSELEHSFLKRGKALKTRVVSRVCKGYKGLLLVIKAANSCFCRLSTRPSDLQVGQRTPGMKCL